MTPFVILFIIVFAVGFLIAMNYLSASKQDRITPIRQIAEIDWDAINDEIVQTEIARGNKIGAIKRYRELTGLGLKDAKDAIDYAMLHPDERGDKKKKSAYDAQDAGIRDLIQDGRLDEAVEIYQKFAGVDAYTARDAVDEIARDLHLSTSTASRTTFDSSSTDKTNHN
ncbi:MAG: hypothetical protein GC179_17410 [Anaerolineaceae bacterium]|nr:hypothetical protein [Anaerolineaceae bacterium]